VEPLCKKIRENSALFIVPITCALSSGKSCLTEKMVMEKHPLAGMAKRLLLSYSVPFRLL